MQRKNASFSVISEHNILTELYFRCGLEISENWVKESGVFFSEALFFKAVSDEEKSCDTCKNDIESLIGAYSLSRRHGVTVLDYIAVKKDHRNGGVGTILLDGVKEKCEALGIGKIYLTAKAGGFFLKNGARELSEEMPLYGMLLGECALCDQRGRDCFPSVMTINIK